MLDLDTLDRIVCPVCGARGTAMCTTKNGGVIQMHKARRKLINEVEAEAEAKWDREREEFRTKAPNEMRLVPAHGYAQVFKPYIGRRRYG